MNLASNTAPDLTVAPNGVTWNGTLVGSGATETVASGGLMVSGIVGSGGVETVQSVVVVSSAVVSGSQLVIGQGAIVDGAIMFAGSAGTGTLLDESAGVAGNTIIRRRGDTIDLASIGYVSADPSFNSAINELTVSGTGGTYTLQFDPDQYFISEQFETSSDGADGTDVTLIQTPLSGSASIPSGATTYGVTVTSGGSLTVASGAAASGTNVNGSGMLTVQSGGIVSGGTVSDGGTLAVGSGGSVAGATVSDGGYQIVQSGGVASDTLLTDPGSQTVVAGGTSVDALVSGGERTVYGVAIGTTLMSGSDPAGGNQTFSGTNTYSRAVPPWGPSSAPAAISLSPWAGSPRPR